MNSRVRSLLFDPLTSGTLRILVPECLLPSDGSQLTVPAVIEVDTRKKFKATLHFSDTPPSIFETEEGKTLEEKDQITIGGLLESEIPFEMKVFPGSSLFQTSQSTSKICVDSNRIHLLPISADTLTTNELRARLGDCALPAEETEKRFSAHLVFHGPKLHLMDSGTRVVRTNEFLGEASSATFDTHQFSGDGWEAALIQKDEEIHLHIRNKKGSVTRILEPASLVDRITFAVAFIHGFQPWPAYKELRIDNRVVECWVSTHIHLKQSWFAPIPHRLGIHAHVKKDAVIMNILPTIIQGLSALEPGKYRKIKDLLWHVLATDTGEQPPSTKLLLISSAIDGLIKLLGEDRRALKTKDEWMLASKKIGLSWDAWLAQIWEIRKKHRNDLAHGRLWLLMETGPDAYFNDYPCLGCAFMALIAAGCGYEGHILTDPTLQMFVRIADIKISKP